MEDALTTLTQSWPRPRIPSPIILIGAGGIVNDSHLPAYRACGLQVEGVFDTDAARARDTADRWKIPSVLATLPDAACRDGAVFDIAIPPEFVFDTLAQLPDGAAVLIQKPLGTDLADADRIARLCRVKRLTAAVNFQLRFSPMMLALRDAVGRGLLGRIVECEVRVNCHMPWHLWPFLTKLPRMEILQHSIHYLDTVRMLLGEPRSALARTVKHPECPDLASSRSSIVLDYGDDVRCCLSINHHHRWGPRFAASELRIEGTRGAAVAKLGVNLNYPHGEPDELWIAMDDHDWRQIPLRGNWFPHAFEGPMCNLQRCIAGDDKALLTDVDNSLKTMALVEACYQSDAAGGTPIPRVAPTGEPSP
ncbi:MAG: Gfo/Idh/MocA family oxidoreductase [Phycisphaerales bacterium]|nr:Gfo/Idh/MocA family oxidoreductase [Phycisphaerales bacterium]